MNAIENFEAKNHQPGKDNWVETVRGQVSSLRFGLVQIVVHNGRVVQIERTEKIRFDANPEESH